MDETSSVMFHDGREIILRDDTDLSLSVSSAEGTESVIPVPCPAGGYGGGGLSLSPSEQYLLFFCYSGQSEEAFILYRVEGCSLSPIYTSGYSYGEDAGYYFSGDEAFLFQTLRTGWWYAEGAETDENGEPFYEFGAIRVLDIGEARLNTHTIRVYPGGDWEEEVTDCGPFRLSESTDGSCLHLTMPWGPERLPLPLRESIALRPGRGSVSRTLP